MRRPFQQGSVFLHGKWWKGRYRAWEIGADGKTKRVQKSVILGPRRGADKLNKAQASFRLAQIVRATNEGRHRAESTMTLAQFVDQYTVFENVRESTLQPYLSEYKRHLQPFFGSMRLCDIEPSHVKGFLNEKAKTLSRKTLMELRNLLSVVLRQPHEWGWLERNPARLVRVPQGAPSRRRAPIALTLDQSRRFLAVLPGPCGTMLRLVLMTGLTRSELLALRWRRVDFDQHFIQVAEAVVNGRFQETKTPNRVRILPLEEPVLSDLQRRYEAQGRPAPERLVFFTRRGNPCDPNAIARQVIKPACRAAKVPEVAWHDLRHTHGTLIAPFLPDYLVRRQLGHSGSGVTFKVYVHDDVELRRQAVRRLAALLFPNVPHAVLEQEGKEEYKREQCATVEATSLSRAVN